MLKTYRLVADTVDPRESLDTVALDAPVCIDIVIRGSNARAFEAVDVLIHAYLNVGPFGGAFVDSGTERDEAGPFK